MEQSQTHVQDILHSMFRIVFSEKNMAIGTITTNIRLTKQDKQDVLFSYKKQYDFWNSKRTQNTKPVGKFTAIKNQICEAEILKICKEVEKRGWRRDFAKLLLSEQ